MKRLACATIMIAAFGALWTIVAFAGPPDLSFSGIQDSSFITDPREMLNASLRSAARDGRIKDVRHFLDEGADPNGIADFGETALMYAARFNQIDAVKTLLDAGARTDEHDTRGQTALMQAAMSCSHRVMDQLIAAGADVNLSNYEGRTALVYVSRDGCALGLHSLLRTGRRLSLDAHDDYGKTALDYAAEEAQLEVDGPYAAIVQELRSRGAKSSYFIRLPDPASALPEHPMATLRHVTPR